MEDILIPLIVFTFVYLTIRMFLEFRKSKSIPAVLPDDKSLGISEIQAAITAAVEEAVEPLMLRLGELEARDAVKRLPLEEEPKRMLEAPEQPEGIVSNLPQ